MFQPPNAPVRVQCTMGTPNTHAFRHVHSAFAHQQTEVGNSLTHSTQCSANSCKSGVVDVCTTATAVQHSTASKCMQTTTTTTFCPTRAKLQPHSKLLAPNSKPSSVQTSPDPSVWSSDLVSPHYERKVPSLPPDRTFHSKWSISNLLFRKWWWGKHMETKKSQHTLNRKCSNVTNKLNYPIHSKIQ